MTRSERIQRTVLGESAFIFFPERPLIGTPADIGLTFEDLRYEAADGTALHGWLVPGREDLALLWFHGNAGNISHRLPLLRDLHRELGVTILIHEYRGYGGSEGSPSERGLYLDAEAALGVLIARLELAPERIVPFGQSLGSAVAIELATRHRPAALIVESAFTSVPAMARRHYPWLPVWPLLSNRFDSLAKIGRVAAPVLVVHGDRDEIVPLEMGRSLFQAAVEPKRLEVIEGAGHNDLDLVGGRAYWDAPRAFLAAHGLQPNPAGK